MSEDFIPTACYAEGKPGVCYDLDPDSSIRATLCSWDEFDAAEYPARPVFTVVLDEVTCPACRFLLIEQSEEAEIADWLNTPEGWQAVQDAIRRERGL